MLVCRESILPKQTQKNPNQNKNPNNPPAKTKQTNPSAASKRHIYLYSFLVLSCTKKEKLKNLSANQRISLAFVQNSKKNSYQFIISYQCSLSIGLQFAGNVCGVLLGHYRLH